LASVAGLSIPKAGDADHARVTRLWRARVLVTCSGLQLHQHIRVKQNGKWRISAQPALDAGQF